MVRTGLKQAKINVNNTSIQDMNINWEFASIGIGFHRTVTSKCKYTPTNGCSSMIYTPRTTFNMSYPVHYKTETS